MGFPTLSLLERETLTHIRQSPGRSDNVDHANRANPLEAEDRSHSIERRLVFAVSRCGATQVSGVTIWK
jgi:hypothetical protein